MVGQSVLSLIDTREVSGPCRNLFQLIHHAGQEGVRFILGMFVAPPVETTPAIEDARRRGFSVITFRQKRRYDASLVAQVSRVAREHQPGVLQSHGYKPALLAWYVKRLTGLPWIAFAHGYTRENIRIALYNALDRWLMRRADLVVAVSNATARVLLEAGVREDRVRVVHNAVEPAEYELDADGTPFRRQIGVEGRQLLAGVIGRFSPEKGQRVLIEAFLKVARSLPDSHLVLVGEGLEGENIRRDVRAAGLVDRVHFAGFQRKMSPIYAALDLVIIPSLSEGLPNVLLEAMLHGKPVVATSVGGIPEVLQGSLARFCVPPGNPEALANAIVQVMRQPELQLQFVEQAEGRVRTAFSPVSRAKRMLTVYEECMDGAQTSN